MRLQSQILQTLRTPEAQARLGRIVAQGACESRAALGREVCAQFDFVDACGTAQLTGCLKALADTGARSDGFRCLRPASMVIGPRYRCLDTPVPAPVEVPAQVRDIEGLRLVVVEDEAQRRIWNTLLAEEHPQGTTTFVGCQLRYLIGSAHGWLGAVGLSASALHVHARDTWMGWSDAQRKAHLHRVVCLSRFLICPAVRVSPSGQPCAGTGAASGGSRLRGPLPLSTVAGGDFRRARARRSQLPGGELACASATPRGVDAATVPDDGARTVKSVYMYELVPHWRRSLGVARIDAAPSRSPGEGLDSAQWAENEFGGAPLGDKRLSARPVRSATLLASCPGRAFTGAPDRIRR